SFAQAGNFLGQSSSLWSTLASPRRSSRSRVAGALSRMANPTRLEKEHWTSRSNSSRLSMARSGVWSALALRRGASSVTALARERCLKTSRALTVPKVCPGARNRGRVPTLGNHYMHTRCQIKEYLFLTKLEPQRCVGRQNSALSDNMRHFDIFSTGAADNPPLGSETYGE